MSIYDNYKHSGIEWIGEIPGHWEVKRFKFWANYQKGRMPSFIDFESAFESPIYLSMDYLRGTNSQIQYAVDNDGCTFIENEDILLLWDGSNAGEFVKGKKGVLSSTMVKVTPNENVEKKFCWHELQSFESELKSSTYGMGIPHVNSEFLKNSFHVLPPLQEQTAITLYLDTKTTEIDQTIAGKEALINLYEEEKKALINEAVTKGLNPKVKLKPSGIDWLGDIPEHWEVKRIKYLSEIISKGTTPSTVGGDIRDDATIIFIKAENIKNNGLDFSSTYFIDEETNKLIARSTLQENDILFVIAGATIGKVAILSKQYTPANTNQAISFIRLSKGENHKFVWYWLQSIKIQEQMWLDAVQSAQPNLSMENLGNFYIPYPASFEQVEIVQYIETETYSINEKIKLAKQEIELLKEYRQALIFEAVTGKIKVYEE